MFGTSAEARGVRGSGHSVLALPPMDCGDGMCLRDMGADQTLDDVRLAEAVRRLRDAYAPERIYLFGFRARGDAGRDSDYDLLIVVSDDTTPEARGSRLGHQALRGTGIAADVVVCTHDYFEARVHLRASLPGIVAREGRLLHAA
jgi:predicted nucleotidyltransferase